MSKSERSRRTRAVKAPTRPLPATHVADGTKALGKPAVASNDAAVATMHKAICQQVGTAHADFMALHDIAARLAKTPFTFYTVCIIVKPLSAAIIKNILACDPLLRDPVFPSQHVALKELCRAVSGVRAILDAFDDLAENGLEYGISKATLGTLMTAAIMESGRAVDRVLLACDGPTDVWDYLGDPDDADPAAGVDGWNSEDAQGSQQASSLADGGAHA